MMFRISIGAIFRFQPIVFGGTFIRPKRFGEDEPSILGTFPKCLVIFYMKYPMTDSWGYFIYILPTGTVDFYGKLVGKYTVSSHGSNIG